MQNTQKAIQSYFRDNGEVELLAHDIDDSSDPQYYGYAHYSGAFMIVKVTSGTYRYYKGRDTYATSWATRASLSYDYIFNLTY